MRSFVASPVFSIAGFGTKENRHFIHAAHNDGLVIVSAPQPPPDALRAHFSERLLSYTMGPLSVQHVRGGIVQAVEIPNDQWILPHIQPLGPDNWLVVGGRAETEDHNATVYDTAGNLLLTFPVGDGVKDVQTTANGEEIWVSYFDEGVFTDQPLSPSHDGLVCFGPEGQILFRFGREIAQRGLAPFIADCYAMNVHDKGNVYLCYYGDFPLLQIRAGRLIRSWQGLETEAIAITERYALLAPKYASNPFHLMYLDTSHPPEEVLLMTETGKTLEGGHFYTRPHRGTFARDSRMYIRDNDTLYCLDLAQVSDLLENIANLPGVYCL